MFIKFAALCWSWLRALVSPTRLLREMESMPYRGQPLYIKKKRLIVYPKSLIGRWGIGKGSGQRLQIGAKLRERAHKHG